MAAIRNQILYIFKAPTKRKWYSTLRFLTFIVYKVTALFSLSYQMFAIMEQDYYWNPYECSNFHFQFIMYLQTFLCTREKKKSLTLFHPCTKNFRERTIKFKRKLFIKLSKLQRYTHKYVNTSLNPELKHETVKLYNTLSSIHAEGLSIHVFLVF